MKIERRHLCEPMAEGRQWGMLVTRVIITEWVKRSKHGMAHTHK